MTTEDPRANHWLPRLDPGHYQGLAAVFWTFSVLNRATGWLEPAFHHHFREILLHAGHRYNLVCPAYVLMPDHLHFLWLGVHEKSDQRKASAFFALMPFPVHFAFRSNPTITSGASRSARREHFKKSPTTSSRIRNAKDWLVIGGTGASADA